MTVNNPNPTTGKDTMGTEAENDELIFIATTDIAARTKGPVLWCVTRPDLFAPALRGRVMGLLQGTGKVASGKIVFDGQDLSKASEKDFQKIRGNGIGLVPQDPNTNLNPLWRVGFQIRETLKANNAEEGDATEPGEGRDHGIPPPGGRVVGRGDPRVTADGRRGGKLGERGDRENGQGGTHR